VIATTITRWQQQTKSDRVVEVPKKEGTASEQGGQQVMEHPYKKETPYRSQSRDPIPPPTLPPSSPPPPPTDWVLHLHVITPSRPASPSIRINQILHRILPMSLTFGPLPRAIDIRTIM